VKGLELIESSGGTRLRLRVKAGARKTAIQGAHGGKLKLSVTAPPDKGKANKAVLELLADRLGLATTELQLLSGHTSQDKLVQIPLPPDAVARRLSGHQQE
jgi:uncharacterized protein (TIGR00251 family)